ncbi:T9SS type A sorting domain-containing protein [Pseudoflavitalea sp. X16]|uniref:DUF7619 domain-containing protein n=1 Tax=Paraflavitalea devenefica TaxID=2716334 RepID=UPI001422B882|nr:T9SS type A sorting domain-containing protein [Paraflavitalea devenefica]NII27860.1 T9SS type A sorting domain-containing protein [Paraflavitalea devenefica]
MRYLFLLSLLLGIVQPLIGQVTRLEYFIDHDPGWGNGTAINITAGNDIQQNFTAPLTNVEVGYHTLYLRARDAQGRWSLTAWHAFYVLPPAGNTVTGAEYFFDTDPGAGQGIALPVTGSANTTLNYTIPLDNLSYGFHTLFVRMRDNESHWSLTQQKLVYLDQSSDTTRIKAFDYYFERSGVLSSTYTYTLPAPALAVSLDFTANLSELEPEKEYTMYIWAVTNTGQKSLVHKKQVKVCAGNVAKAGFDFITEGTQVNFIDSAAGVTRYTWHFGDKKSDTISTPFHIYDSVGSYIVKQIVSNFCNADSLTKQVVIRGLKSISSDKGGNTGFVTVDIRGAGFAKDMIVYLHKTGEQNIKADTPVIQHTGLLSAAFNLTGSKKGIWDVIAVFPDGKKDTLFQAFTIEDGTEPKLAVKISGNSILRIGFQQVYNVTYTNTSNTDAAIVPLYIGGLPLGTDIEVLNPLFKLDGMPGADTLHLSDYPVPPTHHDTLSNSSYRLFLLDRIPAHSTGTLQCVFHVPDTTPLHILPQIKVSLGKPLAVPPAPNSSGQADPAQMIADINYCLEQVTGIAMKKILEKRFGADKDFTGIYTCFSDTAIKKVLSYFYTASPKRTDQKTIAKVLDFSDLALSMTVQGLGCARVVVSAIGLGAPYVGQPLIVIPAVVLNQRLQAIQHYVEYAATVAEIARVSKDCVPVFKYDAVDVLNVIIGNAWDPNAKYGPGDGSQNHFTTSGKMHYTIGFENDPAANLNVQTVTVTDTLSSPLYNLGSFGFTGVTIGDSVYTLRTPVQSFFHDFDFIARYGVKARVVATFSPATGIIQWKFYTIDPSTNQITTHALDGFLPPDKISPKGQGYVSFVIDPVGGIQSGDAISNKAYIKFDYNPVIITNTWLNVFDLNSPASRIQNLPAQTTDTTFTVRWDGTDDRSGIRSYDIYYAINNGPFQLWLYDITAKEAIFTGTKDSLYKFYSIAKDYAGNIENSKTQAEASILVTGKVTGINDPPGDGFYVRSYPNPATTTTWLEFSLPQPQQVRIVIRDLQGKEISAIANRLFTTGTHKLKWDVRHLPAGIYIIEFDSKKSRKSSKLVKQ